jgi:hypothetical protein
MEFLDVCAKEVFLDELCSLRNLSESDNLDHEEEEEADEEREDNYIEIIIESEDSEDRSWASEMDDFIVPDHVPVEYTRLKKRTNRSEQSNPKKQKFRKLDCGDEDKEEEEYSC